MFAPAELTGIKVHIDPEPTFCLCDNSYDPPFRILARTNEIWVRKVESGADDVKAFR